MSLVTLAEAKKHLAVIHTSDDDLIQINIDAAESYAASYMGRRSLEGVQECPWIIADGCACESSSESSSESEQPVPAAVKQAVLLLVGEYYENRQQGVTGTIYTKLPAVESLLHFHRVGLGA
ncbi:head-tail connector protein [Lysobacter sp. F6437]|uniref:head-tail connector protein n=1 Tax=Lysobacter sp. F6437 TaxID=3459296 RepID=UPI00403DD587